MKYPLLPACVVLALLSAVVPAQLVVGDIGVVSFSSSQFWILHANGTSTPVSLAFPNTTHALLYDPSHPNTFLVGGSGYVGRITMTSASTATYASITTAIGWTSQITFDGSQLVVCDSGNGQMVRVDPTTGVITPITSGPQPWGTDMNSGCIDPNTGDVYAGGLGSIYKIPSGSSTPVLFASGWGATSSVSGLTIDPISLQVVASLLTYGRVARFDSAGAITDLSILPGCNSVEFDRNGDFVVGASSGQTKLVPNAGGTAVTIGTTGFLPITWASPVVARFTLNAAAPGAGAVTLALAAIPAGTLQGYTVASFDVSLPVGTGPIFGFNPDALSFALVLGSPTASAGNPVHWTWPVAAPNYPAAPFFAGAGTVGPGSTVDLIAVAINAAGHLTPTPVVRLNVN